MTFSTAPTSTGAHTPTGTPTATPPPYTTNHGQFTSQIPDERQKINIGGLIAGV